MVGIAGGGSVLLILLLVLLQELTVTLKWDGGATVELDYSLLCLILTPGGQKKRRRAELLPMALPAQKALTYVVRRARITLNELSLRTGAMPPDRFGIVYKNVFSLLAMPTAWLAREARSFTLADDAIAFRAEPDAKRGLTLDADVACPLFVFLNGTALFLAYRLKGALGREKRARARKRRRNDGG